MKESIIQKAAAQYGNGVIKIEPLGEGLIHRTSKVSYSNGQPEVVLQCINQRTFSQPENIIHNYLLVYEHLRKTTGPVNIPPLLPTHQHKYFWIDEEDNFWRATRFIPDSYSLRLAETEEHAYASARCFAEFTRSLTGIDTALLNVIIPDFHNLQSRYHQFEESIGQASMMRLLRSTHVISELRQRKKLVEHYLQFTGTPDYPLRAMHHDCKISNILFDHSETVICPVDLDTVMPGLFFSDIGDMIRSMACSVDENSTAWENIGIRGSYYQAILNGYLDGIENGLTEKEKTCIHYSGLIMIYMQSLRYVTDYLNNDIYYKTAYAEQNLNRALNQFILLEHLEVYLEKEYNIHPG
ncbi:MAG: phosphotransferase [Chitinophagaceae bacterium]